MTDNERAQIMKLHTQGYGYKRISDATGIPINAVKAFCYRNLKKAGVATKPTCRHCGKPLKILPHTRTKLYCSDKCRMAWWKEHRDEMNKRTFYKITCLHCGTEFDSYGFAGRKYCSRACFALARTKEVQHDQ